MHHYALLSQRRAYARSLVAQAGTYELIRTTIACDELHDHHFKAPRRTKSCPQIRELFLKLDMYAVFSVQIGTISGVICENLPRLVPNPSSPSSAPSGGDLSLKQQLRQFCDSFPSETTTLTDKAFCLISKHSGLHPYFTDSFRKDLTTLQTLCPETNSSTRQYFINICGHISCVIFSLVNARGIDLACTRIRQRTFQWRELALLLMPHHKASWQCTTSSLVEEFGRKRQWAFKWNRIRQRHNRSTMTTYQWLAGVMFCVTNTTIPHQLLQAFIGFKTKKEFAALRFTVCRLMICLCNCNNTSCNILTLLMVKFDHHLMSIPFFYHSSQKTQEISSPLINSSNVTIEPIMTTTSSPTANTMHLKILLILLMSTWMSTTET